jgi:phosphatidyl-myo-inositol dimannoside synthase
LTLGARDGVLCLVPGCLASGGIQVSARVAWDAIQASSSTFGPPFLFCYGDRGRAGGERTEQTHRPSRAGAVLEALRLRRRFGLVVLWHMDLLKLLPFFRLGSARVILILQGIEAWRRRRWPERTLLERVDLFISISDYTWQRFKQVYPEYAVAPHRTVLLGVGSPLQEPTPAPGPVPAALMLGRLAKSEDYKGHRQMLEAWPLVLQRLNEAQLWIAGDGDLRQELQRVAAERQLGESVRFLGFVTEERKQELVRQCRTMAVPSRGEGFGLVYLEAMRMGRPCLVSTLDAGQEVVRPPTHGLAVDPHDRARLADALCRLLTDGAEWRQLSNNARERYERHFSAQHYQQRLLATLESTLA